jgi:hypothetical protein
MFWFQICAVFPIMWASVVGGNGLLQVQVGDVFALRAIVEPLVAQIDPDSNVIESNLPEAPYVYEYVYDRDYFTYLSAGDNTTATVTEDTTTNNNILHCESSETSSMVYLKALKYTGHSINIEVEKVTANGYAMMVSNTDTINVMPKGALMRIQIIEIIPKN